MRSSYARVIAMRRFFIYLFLIIIYRHDYSFYIGSKRGCPSAVALMIFADRPRSANLLDNFWTRGLVSSGKCEPGNNLGLGRWGWADDAAL